MTNTPKLVDALHEYVAYGACCVALAAGSKRPFGAWGGGVQTLQYLEGVFSANDGLGIGIVCGDASGGLFAIDVDRHGTDGAETVDSYNAGHGPLPRTTIVETPSGGYHLWYRVPEGTPCPRNSTSAALGVDIRGEGGYVVAPPTRLPAGAYGFATGCSPAEVGIADADEAVMGLVGLVQARAHPSPSAASPTHRNARPRLVATEGERNDTLFRYACHVRHMGGDERDVTLMAMLYNAHLCVPPLDEREVMGIAMSACRYERGENVYAIASSLPELRIPRED